MILGALTQNWVVSLITGFGLTFQHLNIFLSTSITEHDQEFKVNKKNRKQLNF
jgi:hypothetical protein